MSEYNYINEAVIPRMPKSVSDEQLFVFVPLGSDTVAGIFKINTSDFKIENSILTIVESSTVDKNATGYVRGNTVYNYVNPITTDLKEQITNLGKDKQNVNLSDDTAKAVGATTVEGALVTINNATARAQSTADAAQTDARTANTTANNAETTAKDAKTTAGEAKAAVEKLDEQVGANTDAISTLDGQVTDLDDTKQDKAIDLANIEAKTVEGALTELDAESSQHTKDIENLRTEDGKLEGRIENLEQSAYSGETPIGTYPSSTTLPTDTQLTAFVQQKVSRAPKLGDVVLFTQIVAGDTDKSYKFMYTASGWSNYVIPTVESASNTDKGIVQGTLDDTSGNYQVSIVAGKIADILVKDGTTYKSIKGLLDTLATKVSTAQDTADNVIKKYHSVEFTFVSSSDTTITNFPCKYTANIEGVTISNVADVYFSSVQIPLEIFSSYVQVEAGKVSIFATTKVNYPTSVTVPTVRIS